MQKRLILTGFITVLSAVAAVAQAPANDEAAAKAEFIKNLGAEVAAEVAQLRLPENRALMNARLGSIVWKNDRETASRYFYNAVSELLAAQAIAEESRNRAGPQFNDLLNSQSIRPQILGMIGARDASFALEALYQTRPSNVAKAVADPVSGSGRSLNGGSTSYLALGEFNLEQKLLRMAAEQSPEKAAAILRAAIDQRLTGETLNMLKKIAENDPDEANALAGKVAGKLLKSDMRIGSQFNYEEVGIATSLLTECMAAAASPSQKHIKIGDNEARDLAEKVIALYTDNAGSIGFVPLSVLEPIAKRFVPAAYPKLAKAASSLSGRFGGGFRPVAVNEEYTKFMNSGASADEMIAAAPKFAPQLRHSIFQSASGKLAQAGRYDEALALLNSNFTGDELDSAVNMLNWSYANSLTSKGEYAQAEAVIAQMPEQNRVSALGSYALTLFNKDPKELRDKAASILRQARGLLPAHVETNTDVSQLMQLIACMATVSPEDAFREIDQLATDLAPLFEAWAIVNGFQGNSVRQGEFLMSNGLNFGIYIDQSIFRNLAKTDPERTMRSISAFGRRELRTLMKMQLLESGI